MGKFAKEAQDLLGLVGGKENISAVTHCMTRMRFVLKDESKADVPGIENLACVKGTFTQAGQFQVIIGNEVGEFYKDFTAASGIEGVSKEAVKEQAKDNMNPAQKFMANIAEIFAPIIPALIVGGLMLGFRSLIGDVTLLQDGTATLKDTSQFWAGTYDFLWLICQAIFHMLPVAICWSVTKKMGGTQILGIILGLTLVSPDLLNAYSMGSGVEVPFFDFGFFHMDKVGYQGQVIPAILAGFVLVYLERFFRKIVPEVVSMIFVPFCSLLIAVIVAHAVVGPIGWAIGSWIANIVYVGLTSSLRWIFAPIFGFVYAPLVITGLHHMTNAIDLQLVSEFGGTMLWPMIALSNIAQGSAVLAMIFLQKSERDRQVSVPACISCYMGVTEPALFGVNIKNGFPFICGMIGSAIAATISVGSGVMAHTIGVGGLPGFLVIKSQMGMFLLAMLVAIVVPFVLTFLVGKKKGVH